MPRLGHKKTGLTACGFGPGLVALLAVLLTISALLASTGPAGAATVVPSIAVSLGYTDNVRYLTTARSDGFLRVQPGLSYEAGPQSGRFTASGHLDYYYYFRLEEYTQLEGGDLAVAYNWQPNQNTNINISNTFISTYDAPLLGEGGDVALIRTDTGRRDANTTVLRVDHEFGQGDSVFGQALYSFFNNTDETVEDSRLASLAAGGVVRFNPDWRGEADAKVDHTMYDRRGDEQLIYANAGMIRMMGPTREASLKLGFTASVPHNDDPNYNRAREYQTYSLTLGWQDKVKPTFSYGAHLGGEYVEGDKKTNRGAGNVYWVAGGFLNTNGQLWRLNLFADSKLENYAGLGENTGLALTHRAGGDFSWDIFQHWEYRAYATYVYNDYLQEPQLTDGRYSGDIQSLEAGTSLSWLFAQYMTLKLDYRYLTQNREGDGTGDRSQNRIMLVLTAENPFLW